MVGYAAIAALLVIVAWNSWWLDAQLGGVSHALDIAFDIVGVIGDDKRMPDVRLGLATGSVVMRLGDVFGPPVNLASRLTSVARRNRVLVDAGTARRLPGERFRTRILPGRPMRGFGIVEPVAVGRR